MKPAGFWVRAGAASIDALLVAAARLALGGGTLPASLLGLAYATLTVGTWGASLGHVAAGVRIVRAEDGGPLGYPRAALRALVAVPSGLLLGLGYLMAPFNARKRTLHDYAAGSAPVYAQAQAPARRTALAFGGACLLAVPVLVALWAATTPAGRSMFLRGAGVPRLELEAKESATKNALGSLRATLAVYYGDHGGEYPATLERPGLVQVKDHPASSAVAVYGAEVCAPDGKSLLAPRLRDTGGWGLVRAKGTPCDGMVFVDCTHADTKGAPWFRY